MAISNTLQDYLERNQASYDLIPHPHTGSSMETAEEAHVPGKRLAKAVIIKDGDRYLMVVVPAVDHVDMDQLCRHFGHEVVLASEAELNGLFPDCEPGAVPPTGAAWGMETYLDECLIEEPEVYFEAGDHVEVVRVSADQFARLMGDAQRGHYGHTV